MEHHWWNPALSSEHRDVHGEADPQGSRPTGKQTRGHDKHSCCISEDIQCPDGSLWEHLGDKRCLQQSPGPGMSVVRGGLGEFGLVLLKKCRQEDLKKPKIVLSLFHNELL